jgi:hypothetical protein
MGAAKAVRPLGLEEYLALEREAPVKHELVEGFPHAMAGASDRHNRVVVNLVLAGPPGPGKGPGGGAKPLRPELHPALAGGGGARLGSPGRASLVAASGIV